MDLVITGGNVLTLDGTGARAQAIAISDGKVKAVGASAEIDAMAGPDTRVEHLTGRTLMPGFIDPHTHFSVTTLEPVSVDCSVPPHEKRPTASSMQSPWLPPRPRAVSGSGAGACRALA